MDVVKYESFKKLGEILGEMQQNTGFKELAMSGALSVLEHYLSNHSLANQFKKWGKSLSESMSKVEIKDNFSEYMSWEGMEANKEKVKSLLKMYENIGSISFDGDFVLNELSEEDKECVQNTVQELVESVEKCKPSDIINKIKNVLDNTKVKHPVAFRILLSFIAIFIFPTIQEWGVGVTKNAINVIRNGPSTKAESVDSLPVETSVFILEEQPYYYKVIYNLKENEIVVEKEGYISKKSVIIEKK